MWQELYLTLCKLSENDLQQFGVRFPFVVEVEFQVPPQSSASVVVCKIFIGDFEQAEDYISWQ